MIYVLLLALVLVAFSGFCFAAAYFMGENVGENG